MRKNLRNGGVGVRSAIRDKHNKNWFKKDFLKPYFFFIHPQRINQFFELNTNPFKRALTRNPAIFPNS